MLLIATMRLVSVCGSHQWTQGEGPVGDDVDMENHMNFLESQDTTTVSGTQDMVDELKQASKIKTKKTTKRTPTCSKNIAKEDILQCVESFMEIFKSLIELRKSSTLNQNSVAHEGSIEILNHTEGVEVAIPFWVNAMEVLVNDAKRTQWLQMPKVSCLPWMMRQVDKLN